MEVREAACAKVLGMKGSRCLMEGGKTPVRLE